MTIELVDESETIKVGCNTTNKYYNSTNTCDGCGGTYEKSGYNLTNTCDINKIFQEIDR